MTSGRRFAGEAVEKTVFLTGAATCRNLSAVSLAGHLVRTNRRSEVGKGYSTDVIG